METYEEVLRRIEPKNYTVRWTLAGKPESAYAFTSFEEADKFANIVRKKDYVENVQILRAGRHPSSKPWTPTRRVGRLKGSRDYGVTVNEDAWAIPMGYVDGDADKHGPVVMPVLSNRPRARTNAEKAEWARNNSFETRILGIW